MVGPRLKLLLALKGLVVLWWWDLNGLGLEIRSGRWISLMWAIGVGKIGVVPPTRVVGGGEWIIPGSLV